MKVHFIEFGSRGVFMNILRVKFGGFKNVSKIELTLEKMISLLSINSYGKSNVLSGIDFGFDFIFKPERTKENMIGWTNGIPLNNCIKEKKFEFEFEFEYLKENKTRYNVIYGYSFDWVLEEKKKPEIFCEYLKVKNLNESQKYSNFIIRNKDVVHYKPSETGGCSKKIKIEKCELVINKIKAFDELFYNDIIKIINDIRVYVDRHFDSKESYDFIPLVRKNFDEFSLDNDKNVPRVLYNIKMKYPDKYELIVNTFKDLFPFIEDMEIETIDLSENIRKKIKGNEKFEVSDKIYILWAKDKYLSKNIEFNLMSDGARRVLLIFTYLVLADINKYALVAIEEPENSINPRLLQKYIMALENFSQNVKIIMASHSPYLVNYLNPIYIYLGIPNTNGLANFSKIKKSSVNKIMNEANDLNMLVGDYLFDLMSSTEEEIDTLVSYVE